MTESEDEFAGKIKGYLDRSAAELKPGVAYRLREMRMEALARLEAPVATTEPAFVPAGAHGLATLRPRRPHVPFLSLAMAVLVAIAATAGYQQWKAYQQVKEFEELDAQILSSDLPIDAYLDGGFQAWLKTSTDN